MELWCKLAIRHRQEGELPAWLAEQGIRPDLPPEKRLTAVHPNLDRMAELEAWSVPVTLALCLHLEFAQVGKRRKNVQKIE
jgi:hypothetical protein